MVVEDDILVGSLESIEFRHEVTQLLLVGIGLARRQPRMRTDEPASVLPPSAIREIHVVAWRQTLHARDRLLCRPPTSQGLNIHPADFGMVQKPAPLKEPNAPRSVFHCEPEQRQCNANFNAVIEPFQLFHFPICLPFPV